MSPFFSTLRGHSAPKTLPTSCDGPLARPAIQLRIGKTFIRETIFYADHRFPESPVRSQHAETAVGYHAELAAQRNCRRERRGDGQARHRRRDPDLGFLDV